MRMQRWLAIAILSPAMIVPALAQHASAGHSGGGFSGGGHASGGFSSPHSGGSFSSGSSFHGNAAPQTRATPQMHAMPRYGSAAPVHTGVRAPSQYGRPGTSANSASRASIGAHYGIAARSNGVHAGNSSGHGGNWNHPHAVTLYAYSPRASALGWWLGPWQFYPWLDADLSWDYWHDTGDDDTAIAMAATGADMVEDTPPQDGGADESEAEAEAADPDPPLHGTATQLESGAPSLTLVYRSGQTEQVANYVVSKNGVTVVDASGVRSVPVADLDVQGTINANAQSGMQLPSSWQ
jgi:hypothetical protein